MSSVTGEVVMQTTRRSRVLAYLGPVPHWLYLPVLRRNGPLWSQVVIVVSALGCVACLSGLGVGLWRMSIGRRYRRGGRATLSPYAGWLRWHHYAGLAFGVVTFTWTFSGLLSMDPLPQLSTGGATQQQRHAVAGRDAGAAALDAATVSAAVQAAMGKLVPKEMVLTRIGGRPYWIAAETPERTVVVAADRPAAAFERFPAGEIEALGRAAAPSPIAEVAWLDGDDGYYRSSDSPRPLPVLRVVSNDDDATLGLPRPADRIDRAGAAPARSRQPLAVSRAAQPRSDLAPNAPAALGRDRDRPQRRRPGARRDQRRARLAAARPCRQPAPRILRTTRVRVTAMPASETRLQVLTDADVLARLRALRTQTAGQVTPRSIRASSAASSPIRR